MLRVKTLDELNGLLAVPDQDQLTGDRVFLEGFTNQTGIGRIILNEQNGPGVLLSFPLKRGLPQAR